MKNTVWRVLIASRSYVLIAIHLAVFALSYMLALGVRFDFDIPRSLEPVIWRALPVVLAIRLCVFYFAGNYHGWWRHVTFADLIPLARASTVSSLLIIVAASFLEVPVKVPRSVIMIDWAMTILLLGGLRCCWRYSREQFKPMLSPGSYRKALVYGADTKAPLVVSQIQADTEAQYRVVGFIDPDPAKKRTRLAGIRVLGGMEVLKSHSRVAGAKDLFVVSGVLPGKQLRKLVEECEHIGLAVKMIPPVSELLSAHRLQTRNVDINDLLRRDPVRLNDEAISELLEGATVLVTGAGGSIGSEICRQVLRFNPKSLILVERAENSLFLTDRELNGIKGKTEVHPCIADILDRRRMRAIMQRHRPRVVFHAAAHKHVPMMEANLHEAVRNNVFGTKGLADLAHATGVTCFVMISTDKAVNPTSVMGVSKHLAERYVNALSETSSTRFVVVRFGNVLGSAGSVVPIFQEQIRRGGPVTITHPEMQRYFMTIPEASQLVLQAASMGRGGEVFVLEMGEPVKIVDLAKDLIRLSGFTSHEIGISFTGIRPGEKLYEELYFEEEQTLPTVHPKVRVAYHRPFSLKNVLSHLAELRRLWNAPDDVIRQKLREIVPEFKPPEDLLNATNGQRARKSVAGKNDS